MTSRQQTSKLKSSEPYLVNTRETKRDVGLKSICKMTKNSVESPPISAKEQPGFSANNSKNNFTSNFNFKLPPFWSHDADSWLAWCASKFTIANIKAL